MLAMTYAQALYGAIQNAAAEKRETLLENLISILEKKGHRSLLPQILREYEKLVEEKQVTDRGVLEVSHEHDTKKFEGSIQEACRVLEVNPSQVDIRTNTSLVGGYLLRKNAEQIDNSYRRKLLDLYRRLVSA